MKIIVLQDHLRSGGTERHAILLTRELAGLGHEARLVAFRPGGRLYALAAFMGGWVTLGLGWAGLSHFASGIAGFVTIVGLRMASVRYGVSAPDPLWLREPKG